MFIIENIALHKPAFQENPYEDSYSDQVDASNAVDGRKQDLSAWGGECVLSEARKHTATLWVDLTTVTSIDHIVVFYMKGNKQWGTLMLLLIVHRFDINFPLKNYQNKTIQ